MRRDPAVLTRAMNALPMWFWRRQDGTVTVFGLIIFVLMVGVGGIAIDVMRYETQRAQLQYTLDRAVLAAASLTQTLEPEAVVQNYFEVAGLADYRLRVNVDEGLNFRRVSAIAEMDMQSLFMQIFGVRVLTSPAAGAAEERIRNIEVSLVIDISGSMGGTRISRLRPAARQFVTDVMQSNTNTENTQYVSVSIVPYNGHVNAGSTIASVFSLTDEHEYSNCTRFYDADFATTALDPAVPIQRMGHFDMSSNWWSSTSTISRPRCQTSDYGAILPWSQNETDLHNLIDSFSPAGTTAIDAGMRWAVGLLDPAAQPALNDLVANGQVHADFENRPAHFTDPETIKVVVLMTDGQNTQQYDLQDHVRSGPSPFWRDPDGEGDISVFYDQWNEYWWEDHNTWSANPDGGDDNDAYQMDWAEVWHRISVNHIDSAWFNDDAWDMEGNSDNSTNHWRYDTVRSERNNYRQLELIEEIADGNDGDRRLRQICDVAHNNGILVFSIAFEAPWRGREVMQDCASSDAHYYDVEGLDITDAFASIARAINQLRLIQ